MARVAKTTRRRGVVRDATPLKVALSESERATLFCKAEAAKMTLADFSRALIISSTVVSRDAQQRSTRVAFLLANLTNNTNQLAKVANSFGAPAQAEVMSGLRRLVAAAEALVAEEVPQIAERRNWLKERPN